MNILIFLPKGFELSTSSTFIDIMGWARCRYGADLYVDTCGFTPIVNASFDVPTKVDLLISEVRVDEYDALVMPGGRWDFGYEDEAFAQPVLDLIRKFNEQGKPIATVCIASLSLGKSGVLHGRAATTYNRDCGEARVDLESSGASVADDPVVVDGNIITSQGPGTSISVAFKLLEMLTCKKTADRVRSAMCYEA